MMVIVVPVALVFFESLCQIMLLNTFLERRKDRSDKRHKALSVVMLIILNILSAGLFGHKDDILSVVLRWVLFSFFVFFVAHLFYQGKKRDIAAISLLIIIIVLFSDFIGLSLLSLVGVNVERVYELPSGLAGMFTSLGVSVAIKLVLLIIVLLIRYMMSIFGKQYYVTRIYMKTRNWLLILVVPIMGLFSIWGLSVLSDTDKQYDPLFLLLSFGWLFVSFIVAHTVFVSSAYEKQLRENTIIQGKNKSSEECYSIEKKKYDQLQALQHDVHKHLSFTREYLKKDDTVKALQYVESVIEDDLNMISRIDTNHEAVNIILNEKISRCKERDIGLVFQLNDLSAMPLEDKDLVIILANVLDNAIEATEKCSGDKVIHIKIIHVDNRIVLSVKNPYEGKLLVQGDKFLTSKNNAFLHGIGLTSVAGCLSKYNGVYAVNGEGNIFQFSAIIPVISGITS